MNKKGITELMYSELVKLIIVLILTGSLAFFIYSATTGEASQLVVKSKEYALLVDAALSADENADVEAKLSKNIGKENYEILADQELEIKEENIPVGTSYRIIGNANKNVEKKGTEDYLEINVKNK